MKHIAVALLGLTCTLSVVPTSHAIAGDLNIVLSGRSYHVDSSHDWNEDNSGLGLEYHFTSRSPWRWVAMANGFRDSNNSMSYMTGVGLHRRLVETEAAGGLYIDAGLNAFVMTRKDVHDNRPFPGVLPSLSIGNRFAGLNLTYLPKRAVEEVLQADMVDPTISGIFFMQFKVDVARVLPE